MATPEASTMTTATTEVSTREITTTNTIGNEPVARKE
jgi:hypothetical protein